MTAVRWFIRIMATILALTFLFVAITGLLIGTETGTRWLLGKAPGYVPGTLTLTAPSGSLLRGVRFESLSWHDGSTSVSADDLLVAVDLLPLVRRRVNIRALAADRLEVGVGSGEENGEQESDVYVDLPVVIALEDARLGEFVLQLDESLYAFRDVGLAMTLTGPRLAIARLAATGYDVRFDVSGRIRLAPELTSRLQASWQTVDLDPALAGTLTIAGDVNAYGIEHNLAEPFVVVTDGVVRLAGDGPLLDLGNRWDRIDYSVSGRTLATPGGTLGIVGSLDSLEVELDTSASVDTYPETGIELAATLIDLQSATIERLAVENDGLLAEVRGTALRDPVPELDLDISASRIDPALFRDDLDGELAAEANGVIRFAESGVEIEATVEGLVGALNGLDVVGSAGIGIAPDELRIDAADIRMGRNNVRGSATVAAEVQVDAEATLGAIGELLPEAGGRADVKLALRGPRDAIAGTARVVGEGLRYGETTLETADVSVQGALEDHTIEASIGAFDMLFELTAGGGLADATWDGELTTLAVSGEALGTWTASQPASATVASTAIRLSELCLEDAATPARACASVERSSEAVTEFDVTIDGLPVAALPMRVPAGVTVAGTIEGQAAGSISGGRVTATGRLAAIGAELAAEYEGEPVRMIFDAAEADATVADNRLDAELSVRLGENAGSMTARLGAADILDPAAAVDGTAQIALSDAGVFAIFVPAINDPRGTIDGDLQVSGTRLQPDFTGELRLADGSFSVRPAGITVREMELRAVQASPGRLSINGSARSGDGQVRIEGNTLLAGETGARAEFRIRGEDFDLLRLPDWQLAASPDVGIVFDEQTALVTGKLGIPTASIRFKTLPDTAVRPTSDAVVHVAGSTERRPGRHVSVDVETELGDDVSFEGFGLVTDLGGGVRIQGGTQQPYLGFGQVDLEGGRYEAYGQDLTIERGQLVFSGPLDAPDLDVRATRVIGDITAGIHLTGRPTQLRSDVFSEPPLSDAETLSYLLTGRPLSGATTSDEGDVLNKAAFALGVSQAGAITSQIGSALGLETFTVEGGAEDGRIVAGKRIGGRLLVEYGYGIVDKLGTLLLRYQVNRRLMLESRTGTVSNLDIVYSVKKK